MAEGLFRDGALQSVADNEYAKELNAYIGRSPYNDIVKFDTFPKYTQKNAISRFLARYEVFKLQLDVPGSILDLGVARGTSLFSWAHFSEMLEPVNYTREIVGFDTFAGFPEVDAEKDTNETSQYLTASGMMVEDATFDDIVEAAAIFNQSRALRHIPRIQVIKGDILSTLPKYVESTPHLLVSLLHLDMDIYRPTKLALELLIDRMPRGAVILFDELAARPYPGETVALMETLTARTLKLKRFPWATTLAYAQLD